MFLFFVRLWSRFFYLRGVNIIYGVRLIYGFFIVSVNKIEGYEKNIK